MHGSIWSCILCRLPSKRVFQTALKGEGADVYVKNEYWSDVCCVRLMEELLKTEEMLDGLNRGVLE